MVPSIPDDISCLLEFENVTVKKKGKLVLDSLSLRINRGENTVILGPNGSGKSSLIKLITRDYYPLADEAMVFRLFGQQTWDIFQMRHLLGIVTDELQNAYLRDIRGMDVVISGFFSSIGLYPNHRVTSSMRSRALEVIEFLGISTVSDQFISEMSAGQARRFLIARALVHDPQVLVLDEPFNSLDLKARYMFKQTLSRIAQAGKNLIIVTHDLEDIVPEIEKVVLLKEGRIFKDGYKDDLLEDDILSRLFDVPVELLKDNGHYGVSLVYGAAP